MPISNKFLGTAVPMIGVVVQQQRRYYYVPKVHVVHVHVDLASTGVQTLKNGTSRVAV